MWMCVRTTFSSPGHLPPAKSASSMTFISGHQCSSKGRKKAWTYQAEAASCLLTPKHLCPKSHRRSKRPVTHQHLTVQKCHNSCCADSYAFGNPHALCVSCCLVTHIFQEAKDIQTGQRNQIQGPKGAMETCLLHRQH
jgi:hypothetical protein